MKINANEIDSIEDAGELAQSPVRMIRTKGGLWIAVGKPAGKLQEEALAAGSHPAIVKYSIEKKYPDFHPSLQKSEAMGSGLKVVQHSHFLTEDLRKAGYDIHSLESELAVEFVVTQHGTSKGSLKALKKGDNLEIVSANLNTLMKTIGQKSMASAISEKALLGKYSKILFKAAK